MGNVAIILAALVFVFLIFPLVLPDASNAAFNSLRANTDQVSSNPVVNADHALSFSAARTLVHNIPLVITLVTFTFLVIYLVHNKKRKA